MNLQAVKQWTTHHLMFAFILIAQVLSGLIFALTYCSDQIVEKYKIQIPTLQTFPTYFIIFLIFSIVACVKKNVISIKSIKKNWWKYFFYAFFDVEANYLIIKSFQYTSPASIHLIDAAIVPIVMVLSIIVYRTRYGIFQCVGGFITVIGVLAFLVVDMIQGFAAFQEGNHPIVGDLLVLVACVCYGASCAISDGLISNSGCPELIFFHGLYASLIVIVQGGILEFKTLMAIQWSFKTGMLFAGFTGCLILYYLIAPVVIKYITAACFNISFMTSDIYTIIYTIKVYKNFTYMYSFGAITIMTGCMIFNGQTLFKEYKFRKAQYLSAKKNSK